MDDQPTVLVGPIIGKVDESSVRILIELDRLHFLTLNIYELRENGQYNPEMPHSSLTLKCNPNSPKIFCFNSLEEKTRYIAIIQNKVNYLNPELKDLTVSFRTTNSLTNAKDPFHIAYVSCNSSKFRKLLKDETNLWKTLSEKIENGEVDYCIHMGDQVYVDDGEWKGEADNCLTKCRMLWQAAEAKIFRKNAIEDAEAKVNKGEYADLNGDYYNEEENQEWEKEKKSLEEKFTKIIQEEYRETWNYKYQAKAMRSVPNIMILDDHEIFDDFGFSDDEGLNANSFKYCFSEIARLCYYKYQKQLWEDVDFNNLSKNIKEHHYHIINGIGIFVQDYRGCFTWCKSPDSLGRILGKLQHDDIDKCFDTNGLFENAKCAVYVSANPLIFLSRGVSEVAAKKINDTLEHWSLKSPEEQCDLLDKFNNYRERTGKEITLVSGDVHIGFFTNIYKDRKYCLTQMVTSSICQKPPSDAESGVVNFLLGMGETLRRGYQYEHVDGTNDMNFGIMEFQPSDFGYKIFGKHVKSDMTSIKEDSFRDLGYRKEIRSCMAGCNNCNIL